MVGRLFQKLMWVVLFLAAAGASAYFTVTLAVKNQQVVLVPDLQGQEVLSGLQRLSDLGLHTRVQHVEFNDTVPQNHIIDQDPPPGREIKTGREVRITVSKGTRRMTMPNLKGLPEARAQMVLSKNGLCLGKNARSHHGDVPSGHVIAQSVEHGVQVDRQKCIGLLVSRGKPVQRRVMPHWEGRPLNEVLLQVDRLRLDLDEIVPLVSKKHPVNRVVRQQPLAGHPVAENHAVRLWVARRDTPAQSALLSNTGVGLFQYRLEEGFLKRRVRLMWEGFGQKIHLIDEYMQPGTPLQALIPRFADARVMLYLDDELVVSTRFD